MTPREKMKRAMWRRLSPPTGRVASAIAEWINTGNETTRFGRVVVIGQSIIVVNK